MAPERCQFPATLARPRPSDRFQFSTVSKRSTNLLCKGRQSLYDYYHTLLRRSDNANLLNPVVSLISYYFPTSTVAILRDSSCIQNVIATSSIRHASWRNLKMTLKRGGRGPAGTIDGTVSNGEASKFWWNARHTLTQGKGWPIIVSPPRALLDLLNVLMLLADSCISSISRLMATSSLKGRNDILRT
jgi:hypothetical protein